MKLVRRIFGTVFGERKIIIISKNRVRNIPINPWVQFSATVLVLGLCSWTSYSTGLYMAYDKVLSDKNTTIEVMTEKNDVLANQYSLMHHDLMRFSKDIEEGSTQYDSFVFEQYLASEESAQDVLAVVDRVGFLENRVFELEGYQQQFLETLGDYTSTEVDQLKEAIKKTGLNLSNFSTFTQQKKQEEALNVPTNEAANNQGGPFISIGTDDMRYSEKQVMDSVSELVALQSVYNSLPVAKPISSGKITSGFGARKDPINKRRAMHYGMDFAAPIGAKVHATAPGKVVFAGKKGAYGKLIEIDHGNGIATRYGHLRAILVEAGTEVDLGTPIGVQGNTGRSTGTHLHYEVRHNNRPVNPGKFLEAGDYARQEKH